MNGRASARNLLAAELIGLEWRAGLDRATMCVMRNWWNWLVAICRWFLGEWRLWMVVAVPLGSWALFSLLRVKPEGWIRYCGLFLEILGILTVAVGLRAKSVLFNKPGLKLQLREAISRFPPRPGTSRIVNISGTAAMSLAGTLGTMHGSIAPPREGAPLEERVAIVEGQVRAMQTNYNALSEQMRRQGDAAKSAIDQERSARERATGELKSKLEKLGADGIHLEMAGVVWLVIGATLATISSEIAKWLF